MQPCELMAIGFIAMTILQFIRMVVDANKPIPFSNCIGLLAMTIH